MTVAEFSTKPPREPARSPPVALYPFPSARNCVAIRFTAPAPSPSPQLRAAACNKSELHLGYFLSGFCADNPCRSPRNATLGRHRQKVLGVWSAPGPGESACFLPADVRRAGEASPEPFKGGRQTATFKHSSGHGAKSRHAGAGARPRPRPRLSAPRLATPALPPISLILPSRAAGGARRSPSPFVFPRTRLGAAPHPPRRHLRAAHALGDCEPAWRWTSLRSRPPRIPRSLPKTLNPS